MKAIIAKIHKLSWSDIFRIIPIKAEIKKMAAPIKLMHPNFLIDQLRILCDEDGDVRTKLDELFNIVDHLNSQKKTALLQELHPVVLGLDFEVPGKSPIKRPKLSIPGFNYGTLKEFEVSLKNYLKPNPAPAAPAPAQ